MYQDTQVEGRIGDFFWRTSSSRENGTMRLFYDNQTKTKEGARMVVYIGEYIAWETNRYKLKNGTITENTKATTTIGTNMFMRTGQWMCRPIEKLSHAKRFESNRVRVSCLRSLCFPIHAWNRSRSLGAEYAQKRKGVIESCQRCRSNLDKRECVCQNQVEDPPLWILKFIPHFLS